jgi:UDP-N-acetyl-D-mannosaminuronate dehydrogenase
MVRDMDAALKGADCAVFVTDHSCYKDLDLKRMMGLMRTLAIVDGRNIVNAVKCRELGFAYRGIGKG